MTILLFLGPVSSSGAGAIQAQSAAGLCAVALQKGGRDADEE